MSKTTAAVVAILLACSARHADALDLRKAIAGDGSTPGGYATALRTERDGQDDVWVRISNGLNCFRETSFYQTRWLQLIEAGVVMLAVWGAHRVRVWQIARRLREQFELRAAEHARIAAELHDDLIQDLAALTLQAEIVDDQLPQEPAAAKRTLETLRARMQHLVGQGRREMAALYGNVGASDSLADALSQAAQELRAANGPSFHLVIEGHPHSLHPVVGDEVYRIVREAMGNAFRHAAAREVEVEISFGSDELRVRIHDDGCGISDAVFEAGRPGHFGLRGMRQRAKYIGASVNIWSRVGVGTEVDVIIPGRAAFQAPSE